MGYISTPKLSRPKVDGIGVMSKAFLLLGK